MQHLVLDAGVVGFQPLGRQKRLEGVRPKCTQDYGQCSQQGTGTDKKDLRIHRFVSLVIGLFRVK